MPRINQLAHLIKTIIPAILTVSPTDDGALYVCYNTIGGPRETLIELSDYEIATGNSFKLNGLADTILAQR